MNKTILIFAFLFAGCFTIIQAQIYEDHFGAGNNIGVSVTSSSQTGTNAAKNTLNGSDYLPDLEGASRFLAQAGFGGSYEEIEYVSQIGINAWMQEQLAMVPNSYLVEYKETYDTIVNMIHAVHPGEEIKRDRSITDYVWWRRVFREEDVFRNKAAFALHQILVVSSASIKLKPKGYGQTSYYDILYQGAFGNFRDLLNDVSLHMLMGYYLSHFQNQKGDPIIGTLPDENYAREIMQLFTIGLYELNNDGTRKLDSYGDPIPTYDITDIQELAKVFTGLSGGAWDTIAFPEQIGQPLKFNSSFNKYDMTVPMIMWEDYHDQGQKVLIDGTILPAGQPGMQDIQDVLDVLFNHPNVGPFIGYRLIQQLVKSNPSPQYVNRVASAFNNNGYGVRGDMKAVFEAVLLDPEARNCELIDNDAQTGKLKQPLERFIALCRGFDVDSPSGKLWMSDHSVLIDRIEQTFMGAPTVFNFFTPFYQEENFVKPAGMVSPEFQILHSVTAIHYLNMIEDAIKNKAFKNYTLVNPDAPRLKNNDVDEPFLDFSDEITLFESNGLSALLDRLDIILCHGELTQPSRTIIEDALIQLIANNFTSEDIIQNAIYLITISSDFTILR